MSINYHIPPKANRARKMSNEMSVVALKQIRIQRLNEFARTRRLKGPVAIGSAIGKSASQSSDLLSGTASFGEKVARSIERSAGIPSGWLDKDSDGDNFEPTPWPLGNGSMLPAESTTAPYRLSPLHQATIDALTESLRLNKLSDLDCLDLMRAWLAK